MRAKITALMNKHRLSVELDTPVENLSVGEKQRIEILKALVRGARVLILDEPTAVLTPQEACDLFNICRKLASEGYSIVFISHKLDEVLAVCHRATVLRHGRVVGTVDTSDVDARALTRMMVGRDVLLDVPRLATTPGPPVLETVELSAQNDDGLPALRGVSLTVRAGEIVGIAGVDGNGQLPLVECLMGLRRRSAGVVRIAGSEIAECSPAEIIARGTGYSPPDRSHDGLALDLSVRENLILEHYHRYPFSYYGILAEARIRRNAEELIRAFQIRPHDPDVSVRHLSGGNQQKVILARILSTNPKLLIVVQPTRGLDVGATEFVRTELLRQRARGVGILLVSTELDEILSLSDHILVMFRGQIVGRMPRDSADLTDLGLMMAGQNVVPRAVRRPSELLVGGEKGEVLASGSTSWEEL
jgi:simple sugar transport system ATP-binding protein